MVQQLSTNTFTTAKWIVSATASNGTHTTIASALTSASSGDTIFIRPGTYTENLTLKAGVNLCAFTCDAYTPNVTIIGKLTASFAGTCSLSGIKLQTNSDFALDVTGSSATIVNLIACNLVGSNNHVINYDSTSSSSQINLYNSICDLATTGIFFILASSTGNVLLDNHVGNNSGGSTIGTSMASTGLKIQSSVMKFSISCTPASPNIFSIVNSQIDTSAINRTGITFGDNVTGLVSNCTLQTGTALTVSVSTGCVITLTNSILSTSNTNVISAAGTVQCGNLTFTGSSRILATTLTSLVTSPFTDVWTPTVVGSTSAGTATYVTQVGRYTRIGPLVYVTFTIAWNTGTGSGNLLIGGLPVNIVTTTNLRPIGSIQLNSASSTPPANTVSLGVVAAGDANTTQLFVQATLSTGLTASVAYSATGSIIGSLTYFAS